MNEKEHNKKKPRKKSKKRDILSVEQCHDIWVLIKGQPWVDARLEEARKVKEKKIQSGKKLKVSHKRKVGRAVKKAAAARRKKNKK